jgi:predicted dehydrogenase
MGLAGHKRDYVGIEIQFEKGFMKSGLNIGVVGLGLIGKKRAAAICATRRGKLIAAADTNAASLGPFAEKFGCETCLEWRSLTSDPRLDAIIVAVPNAYLTPIALEAIRNRKHVLCEKPFGISLAESMRMHRAAQKTGVTVKVGFNHRFHAALLKAHEVYSAGSIGELIFIRARYGHGGRKGMEKEWRFDFKVSGGGELLDQGVHLIDLAYWFAGPAKKAFGVTETKFWKTTVDDNAFGILRNDKVTFEFHVSTTNWKNIFSFEVFGSHGYLQIEGKGGSYGEERLTVGRRRAQFGVPIVKEYTFPSGDLSWNREWVNFVDAVAGKATVCGGTLDGAYSNAVIETLYQSSASGRELPIRPIH